MTLIGIDGCRAGWVVATASPGLTGLRFTIAEHISAALDAAEAGDRLVCIDIPIGLPDSGPRECDLEARRRLRPKRGSSVFPAPMRAALAGDSYEERCRLNREACGKALSKQASAIVPKIREVDLALTPEMQSWVREVHPEVSFAMLAGTPMVHRKAKAAGRAERLEVLRRHGLECDPVAERLRLGLANLELDDLVDAAVCLLTARRLQQGRAVVLGGDLDSRGLRMEMVV